MMRSTVAARFAQLVEEPPLAYLTRWRLQEASRPFETSSAGVDEVAKRAGDDAQAALSKALLDRRAAGRPSARARVAMSFALHFDIPLVGSLTVVGSMTVCSPESVWIDVPNGIRPAPYRGEVE
jgi:hypothetical protein